MLRHFCAASAAIFCLAALQAAPAAQDQKPIFTTGTTGVRVDVLVLDHNVPVAGLAAADFDLKDNGVTQIVTVVESSDVPINVVLAFDTSGSTEGKRLTDLTDAARALVSGLKPHDRVALTTFNHAVVERVPLTFDFARIVNTLAAVAPSGETAIMDGIHSALMTTQAEAGRSLVIVCTDGRDTQSWLQGDEVAEVAKRSNAVIYAVAAGAARRWADMKTLTDITGGHMIEIEKSSDFRAQLVHVIEEFRSRYVLAFTPTGVATAGLHRLDVKVVGHGGVTVKARTTYISGAAGGVE
jgi:Ca-activated chloride channel family protein